MLSMTPGQVGVGNLLCFIMFLTNGCDIVTSLRCPRPDTIYLLSLFHQYLLLNFLCIKLPELLTVFFLPAKAKTLLMQIIPSASKSTLSFSSYPYLPSCQQQPLIHGVGVMEFHKTPDDCHFISLLTHSCIWKFPHIRKTRRGCLIWDKRTESLMELYQEGPAKGC